MYSLLVNNVSYCINFIIGLAQNFLIFIWISLLQKIISIRNHLVIQIYKTNRRSWYQSCKKGPIYEWQSWHSRICWSICPVAYSFVVKASWFTHGKTREEDNLDSDSYSSKHPLFSLFGKNERQITKRTTKLSTFNSKYSVLWSRLTPARSSIVLLLVKVLKDGRR